MRARIAQVGLKQIPAPILGLNDDEINSDAAEHSSQMPQVLLIGFAHPHRAAVPHNLKKEEADEVGLATPSVRHDQNPSREPLEQDADQFAVEAFAKD